MKTSQASIAKPRTGWDERVGAYRAKPCGTGDLDSDPSIMVQEQISRRKFFGDHCDVRSHSVLDLGCGTGFNCEYLRTRYGAPGTLGIDISPNVIAYARKRYPDNKFAVADVCDSGARFGKERWDRIICCEVIEHVEHPGRLLANVSRHLNEDGIALITTPNLQVFSLGRVPSPLNATHIKEFTCREFETLLRRYFRRVALFGQRFTEPALFHRRQNALRRTISDVNLLGDLYWNGLIRRVWKTIRLEPIHRLKSGALRWRWTDFAFDSPPSENAVWLCAIVQP
jgi:SAM-dependent methyltransferase